MIIILICVKTNIKVCSNSTKALYDKKKENNI